MQHALTCTPPLSSPYPVDMERLPVSKKLHEID